MKFLLADDHALLRLGLGHELSGQFDDLDIVEAGDFQELRNILAEDQDFALVLIDLNMPGGNGFNEIEAMLRQIPSFPVVVISASNDFMDIDRVMKMGVSGYLYKGESTELIVNALRLVLAGGKYIPSGVLNQKKSANQETSGKSGNPVLTPRQNMILKLIIEGQSNKQIAKELDLAEATVKSHISTIFRSLGVHSRTQAIAEVIRLKKLNVQTFE